MKSLKARRAHPQRSLGRIPDGAPHAERQPQHVPPLVQVVSKGPGADGGHQDVLQVAGHAGGQGVVVARADKRRMVDRQAQRAAHHQHRLSCGCGTLCSIPVKSLYDGCLCGISNKSVHRHSALLDLCISIGSKIIAIGNRIPKCSTWKPGRCMRG